MDFPGIWFVEVVVVAGGGGVEVAVVAAGGGERASSRGGFSCQTPSGGLTPAWKVTEAIKVAKTKRAFIVGENTLLVSTFWANSHFGS